MKIEREPVSFLDDLSRSPLSFRRESSPSVNLDMSIFSDNSMSDDEFDGYDSTTDTEEGRLSRCLQSWMSDHSWSNVPPRENHAPEPIFTGKLGGESKYSKERYARYFKNKPPKTKQGILKEQKNGLRRTGSDDSIATQLSLLTCSSYGSDVKHVRIEPVKEKRRRKRDTASRNSSSTSENSIYETSPWIRLAAKKSSNVLAYLTRAHAALSMTGMIAGQDDDFESEAYRLMDKDEQDAIKKVGYNQGITFVDKTTRKRCNSLSNVQTNTPSTITRPRVLSANSKKPWGKALDIAELRRERLHRIAMEKVIREQEEREKEMRRRRKVSIGKRTLSSKSLRSIKKTGRPGSPSGASAISASVQSVQSTKSAHSDAPSTPASISGRSGKSSNMRPYSPSDLMTELEVEEEQVTVWKADRQILEIDLKREFTDKVKHRIDSTTKALKRCSGLGDGNEQTSLIGTHEEFPKHVEDDYALKPRIIQRMRISPQLSGVISDDIKVRMGRPRYHEIRVADLEQWNSGFALNRSHVNLKVFNWLGSLRESNFVKDVLSEVHDVVPDINAIDLDLYHVESADEPDAKPLYKSYEVRIL